MSGATRKPPKESRRHRLASWIGRRYDDGDSSVYDDAGILVRAINAGIRATTNHVAGTAHQFYEAFLDSLERR